MSEPCAFWPGCGSVHEGGCADCPAEISALAELPDEFYDRDDDGEDWPPCPTCKGSGTVNPLTAPQGFVCFVVTECPTCDGTGECP